MIGSSDKLARTIAVTTRGSVLGHNYTNLSDEDMREGANNKQDPYNFSTSTGFVSGLSDIFPLTGGQAYNQQALVNILPSPLQQNIVRILRPHNGEFATCWLDLDILVAAIDSDLTLKIAIGQIGSDGLSSAQTNYSEEYINQSWQKIYGATEPLVVDSNKHISADRLNLLPALLNYGETGWDQELLVLILQFNKVPTFNVNNRLYKLRMDCSTMGVL